VRMRVDALADAGATEVLYAPMGPDVPRELRALAQRVYSLLRPSMDRDDLTPHRLGHWLTYWSRCASYAKDPKQAQLAEQQARGLAETHQLRDILGWLAFIDFGRSLPERNLAGAERALAAAESAMDAAYLGAHPRMEYLRTKLAVMKGQADRAVFHASRATKSPTRFWPPASM